MLLDKRFEPNRRSFLHVVQRAGSVTFLCITAAILAMAGCSGNESKPSTNTNTCTDLSGFYMPTAAATCNVGYEVPLAFCISQTNCQLTVASDPLTFTGTVNGSSLSVTNSDLLYPITCTADIDAKGTGTITCDSHDVTICTIPIEKKAFPGLAQSLCCDPGSDACGAGNRCTLAYATGETSVHGSVCTTATATKKIDDECVINADGTDDCSSGLYCTTFSTAQGASCRPFCTQDTDCAADEACRRIKESAPLTGTCLKKCTPFGNDCAAGTQCSIAASTEITSTGGHLSVPTCFTIGTKALGDVCTTSGDCPDSAVCAHVNGPLTCLPQCNPAHPCAAGKTCNHPPMVTDYGFCL